ncbi:hypothetical protein Q2T42_25900 [Leptolyngbya boryana CZ1]|uniref:Uncharacterized protein n=1 Tax=Leptolyngbya boryana CZ1 TaxID=3060204 RepID=A0AA96WT10_LEPBY|nr:hypothetical protein [Leptolyngbya boryana]WNZ45225.1 hypothetical protein Q2T42_25900 [Leptolyngbya boryana CZ1]
MQRWSQQECEDWFVQARKPDLNELSRLSQVPFSTLKRWRSSGEWVRKRSDFQDRVASETREKTIEKKADRMSDLHAQLEAEHLESYGLIRHLAMIRIRQLREKALIQKLEAELSESEMKALAVSLDELNTCSMIIDRCVKGERLVAGAEYSDLNKAISSIERTGLKVVAPNAETLSGIGIFGVKKEGATDG